MVVVIEISSREKGRGRERKRGAKEEKVTLQLNTEGH